ncbi:hypothetical protein REPUB_Repub20aG0125300 [Reevesia pubescens]
MLTCQQNQWFLYELDLGWDIPSFLQTSFQLIGLSIWCFWIRCKIALPLLSRHVFLDTYLAMEAMAAVKPVIKVASLCGSLRKGYYNRGLLRTALEITKESVNEIHMDYVDISPLQVINFQGIRVTSLGFCRMMVAITIMLWHIPS